MQSEAASGGFFHSDLWDRDYPRIQIRTVAQMLSGNSFDLPPRQPMYQPAERVRRTEGRQGSLDELASA
jgi:site-specific DNA-methyltransferase (adenine-specific)